MLLFRCKMIMHYLFLSRLFVPILFFFFFFFASVLIYNRKDKIKNSYIVIINIVA